MNVHRFSSLNIDQILFLQFQGFSLCDYTLKAREGIKTPTVESAFCIFIIGLLFLGESNVIPE